MTRSSKIDELSQGIVELVEGEPKGKEFYIPHKAVVGETTETTKILIVYDAPARAYDNAPSLNDCLATGPPLQNKFRSVLTRNRFQPVALAGNMKQAFLQLRIREEDRDVMRFHWLSGDLETNRRKPFDSCERCSGCLHTGGPSSSCERWSSCVIAVTA